MKTRVKYYQGYYYPQVKGWLFWKHIMAEQDCASFKTLVDAVQFINFSGWHSNNTIVWKSE